MHVEIRFYFASLFLEKHRKKKARSEHTSQFGQKPRTRARPKRFWRVTMTFHQVAPDDYVPVLDVREPRVNVFLFGVRLGRSENAVQVGRVCFVLPVMLERVNVRLSAVTAVRV